MAERNFFSSDAGQAPNTSISIADAFGNVDLLRVKPPAHAAAGMSRSLSVPGANPSDLANLSPERSAPGGSSPDLTKLTSIAAMAGVAICLTAPGRAWFARGGARGIEEGVTVAERAAAALLPRGAYEVEMHLGGAANGMLRQGAEVFSSLGTPGRELATAERGLGAVFKDLGLTFERPTALGSPGFDVHAIRKSLDEAIAWDKAAARDVQHPNVDEALAAVRQRSADAQMRAEQAQTRIRDAQARSEQLAAQEEAVESRLDGHNDVADSIARQKGEAVEHKPLGLDAPLINERVTEDSVVSFLSDGRIVVDQPGYRQIRTYGDKGSIVEIESNGNRTTWTFPKLTQWDPLNPTKFDNQGATSVTEFGNGKLYHRASTGTVTDMPTGERETLVFERLKKWEHRDGSQYIERKWWDPTKQVQRWDDKANGERQYL